MSSNNMLVRMFCLEFYLFLIEDVFKILLVISFTYILELVTENF